MMNAMHLIGLHVYSAGASLDIHLQNANWTVPKPQAKVVFLSNQPSTQCFDSSRKFAQRGWMEICGNNLNNVTEI